MTRRFRLVLFSTLVLVIASLAFVWAQPKNIDKVSANSQTATETVSFIAFGDMGTGDQEQYALAKRMALHHDAHPYDIALTLGDNIYPDGNPADLVAKFEKPYAELLRRGVRFYASLGNHDVKKGRAAQMNYANFNMGGRAYYSFVKGNGLVEFFALDSTAPNPTQIKWLEGALAASSAQWKIAYFHHPLYSSGRTHGSDVALRRQVEPIFIRSGVAAVFCGHDHIYERVKPQNGIQYFVAGAGSGKLRRGDINRKSPFFAAGNDEVGSFMYVEVTRERLAFQVIDAAGNTLDNGTVAPPQTQKAAPPVIAAKITVPASIANSPAETSSENSGGKPQPKQTKSEPVQTEQAKKPAAQTVSTNGGKLSLEEAREIALKSAPGTVEKSELKRKDDKPVYVFKIRSDKESAEVRVSADNGEVVRVKRKSAH